MKVNVARSWSELNPWQLQEIAHLYINTKPEDFEATFQKMVFILFQKKCSILAKMKLQKMLSLAAFEEFAKFSKFLVETTNFYTFPDIEGLIKPTDRLSNLTIKQFSFCDKYFDDWEKDPSEIKIRRFVASLYRKTNAFDELILPDIAAITDTLTHKEREAVALAYRFCKMLIYETYPVIFPKPPKTEEEILAPKFSKPKSYQSFDKIIMGLVFSEEKPLGTKEEANATRLYEFLNVLNESILRFKEKERHANRN